MNKNFFDSKAIIPIIVAVASLVMSIVVICFDNPPPGIAYAVGFTNAALLALLYLFDDEEE